MYVMNDNNNTEASIASEIAGTLPIFMPYDYLTTILAAEIYAAQIPVALASILLASQLPLPKKIHFFFHTRHCCLVPNGIV